MGERKSKSSPYMLFIDEQRSIQPGWAGKSLPELTGLAGPLWTSLTEAQRRVYVERAKGRRGGGGDNNNYLAHCGGGQRVQGLDTRGRRLEEVAKRDREVVEEARSKVASAEEIVNKAERNGTIEESSFFIMHANIFVRTPEDGFVVPAEIALTKFSIEEGVAGAPLQFFPDPGRIPSGYKWSCMETSEVHHKIPLYPDTPSPDKTLTGTELVYTEDGDILEGIRSFLEGCGTVFCMPDNEEDCRGVLEALTKRSRLPPLDLQLLHLPDLLHQLAGPRMLPHVLLAADAFERERFRYHPGLGCAWHEAATDTFKCSLSYVHRWAFTILAFTNQRHGVAREDGRHVPRGTLGLEQEAAEASRAQWEDTERKSVALKDTGGSSYGRGGFPASDIRYRSRDPEAESEAATAAESLTSDLRDLGSDLRDATSEWDTEYESLDPDISIRSSVPSSARSSAAASSARGTLLERLRNRRIAANIQ